MSDQTTVTSINDHDETTLETTTLVHVDIGEEAEFENGLDSSSTTGGMIQDEEPREESRKRTVISHDQRVILESFFNTGMKSASNSLKHLHEAAALQTGLDYYVVKNWVRNRRRPLVAQKKQEVMQHMLTLAAVAGLPQNTTCTSSTTAISAPSTTCTSSMITPIPSSTIIPLSLSRVPPQCETNTPKRQCLESQQQPTYNNLQVPLIVKARIANSGETDFVEVELASISYITLLTSVCEELDVAIADVHKIRKLPNVLVRKDKDVLRMTEGQELEVVLNSSFNTH